MKLKDFDFRLWHNLSESFVEIKSAFITTNGRDEIVFDRAYNVPIDDESVEIELCTYKAYMRTETKATQTKS